MNKGSRKWQQIGDWHGCLFICNGFLCSPILSLFFSFLIIQSVEPILMLAL